MSNSKLHIKVNNNYLSFNPNWLKEIKDDPNISEEEFNHDLWAIAKCYPKNTSGEIDCHIHYPEGDIGSLIPCCPNSMNGFFGDNTTALKITGKTDSGDSKVFDPWWYNPNGIRGLLPPVITNESYDFKDGENYIYAPRIKITNPNPFRVTVYSKFLNIPTIEYSESNRFIFNSYIDKGRISRTFSVTKMFNNFLPLGDYILTLDDLQMYKQNGDTNFGEYLEKETKINIYYVTGEETTERSLKVADWTLYDFMKADGGQEQQKTISIRTKKQIKGFKIEIIEPNRAGGEGFIIHHGQLRLFQITAKETCLGELNADCPLVDPEPSDPNYIFYEDVCLGGSDIPYISYLKILFTFKPAISETIAEKLDNYQIINNGELFQSDEIIHFVKFKIKEIHRGTSETQIDIEHDLVPDYTYTIVREKLNPSRCRLGTLDSSSDPSPYHNFIEGRDLTPNQASVTFNFSVDNIGAWLDNSADPYCPEHPYLHTTEKITEGEYLFTCPSDFAEAKID